MPHFILILFLFALGACIGSFLNVVVWRLPRGQSLVSPPSHCPMCEHALAWYDNIPVFGWIMLAGKCRYCRNPISPRYPIVEALTGVLFVLYYVAIYILHYGPCANPGAPGEAFAISLPFLTEDWRNAALFSLYLCLISALLAASLIDAELFIIPAEIPWLVAAVGIVAHAVIDRPFLPGSLNASPLPAALALGGGLGLLASNFLLHYRLIPLSFEQDLPLLEVERVQLRKKIEEAKEKGEEAPEEPPPMTRAQLRAEMQKEMLFLLPPLIGGGLAMTLVVTVAPLRSAWETLILHQHWLSGLLGALLGGLVGAFIVWLTRILGSLGFGREAMGIGDVHLMFGIGAVIGAGASVVSFFLAPFFGILTALYMVVTGNRRELPYGPYLSLAAAFCILFYCSIVERFGLAQGAEGLLILLRQAFGGASV